MSGIQQREHSRTVVLRRRHFVNAHKGMTAAVVVVLIAVYGAWDNTTAWVYFGLHGGYGLLWLLKEHFFPDAQWRRLCTPTTGIAIWIVLAGYWVAPWLIVTGFAPPAPSWWVGVCVLVFGVGVFFHFTADMQKAITLRFRPGQLITDGLFRRLRNPNYFGELLIYLGFSALALSWIPIALVVMFVAGMWVPNMIRKDRSLARYSEFAVYRSRSKLFIPGVW